MAATNAFSELRPPLDDDAALLEADRCLFCSGPYAPPPCATACPAGVDVPRFLREIADGRPIAAANTIFEENLLGATCARVCPVEVLCQAACVLLHDGQPPVEIARLQRYATDAALAAGGPLRRPAVRNGRRVAVVGAGPAGLACAGELAARGFDVVVYDDHEEIGGTVRTAIAPYRQSVDPLPAERVALTRLGVTFELGIAIRTQERLRELADRCDAVFVGVGLGADRPLGCPGEKLAGVWPSLDFIAALKHGYPPAVGDRVVVIGGGNTAIDVAREATRLGARHVTLAYRRTRDLMPAYAFEVKEAEQEGVTFEWLAAPVELTGDACVEHAVFERQLLGRPGLDGRPAVEPTGERFVLAADTVVVAIGQLERGGFAGWVEAERARGAVVEAGGDAVNGGASVVQAVAEGKRAARAIEEALCAS